MSSGKLMLIGPMILAKERMQMKTFNQPSKLVFSNLVKRAYPKEISIQPTTDAPIIEPMLTILLKSTIRVF